MSVRVPLQTRRWLERFARHRGSAGGAAARLIEEARRKEDYPAVVFRDTPLGRVAYALGTRIQLASIVELGRDLENNPTRLSKHLGWPLWQAESVIGYICEYAGELKREKEELDQAESLLRKLPQVEKFEV